MRAILLCIVILPFTLSKYFITGPAVLTILKAENCSEYKNLPMVFVYKQQKYNATTQLLSGYITLPVDFDDSVGIQMKSSKIYPKGEQKTIFSMDDDNACKAMNKYVGPLWHDIERQLGIVPEICPIKKGNYSATNLHLDLNKMKVQMFMGGLFNTRVIFKQNNKVFYCGDILVKIEPKAN